MTTHSSIFACKIPGIEEPGNSLWGCRESDTTEQLNNNNYYHHAKISIITLTDNWGEYVHTNQQAAYRHHGMGKKHTEPDCTVHLYTRLLNCRAQRDVFMTPVYR